MATFQELFEGISKMEGVKKVFAPTKDCKQFTVFFACGVKVDANEKTITVYPKKGSATKSKKVELEEFNLEIITLLIAE